MLHKVIRKLNNVPLEVNKVSCSFGLLSKLFSNLKEEETKKKIAAEFGLKSTAVLENWFYCLSIIRNIAAHHGRIWNRRTPKIMLPKKTSYTYLKNHDIYSNKIYAAICVIVYILNIISPGHNFKQSLIELMNSCPLLQEKEMGFPEDWRNEALWNQLITSCKYKQKQEGNSPG